MTGYGEARYQSETLNMAIELRALNTGISKSRYGHRNPITFSNRNSKRLDPPHDSPRHSAGESSLRTPIRAARFSRQCRRAAKLPGANSEAPFLPRRPGMERRCSIGAGLPGVVPDPEGLLRCQRRVAGLEKVLEEALGKLSIDAPRGRSSDGGGSSLTPQAIAGQLAAFAKGRRKSATHYRERLFERHSDHPQ